MPIQHGSDRILKLMRRGLKSEGIKKNWHMKKERVSPCYTTRFDELLKVRC